jgi:hypothetical protein
MRPEPITSKAVSTPASTKAISNLKKMIIFSLFSLPVIYIGIIVSVFIHEVFGHGLTAQILGGQFRSFSLSVDGMGFAEIGVSGLSSSMFAIILLSGAFFTTVFSMLFFFLSMVFRKKLFPALTFLFFAYICFLDGIPYFFWDGIYLSGVGDFSLLWTLFPNELARIILVVFCGITMIAGIILFNTLLFRLLGRWLSEEKPLSIKGIIMLSLIILFLQVLGWFAFDWNQLIPGIGILPNIVAIVFSFLSLIPISIFVDIKETQAAHMEASRWRIFALLSWVSCIVVIISVIQWFQKGIQIFY